MKGRQLVALALVAGLVAGAASTADAKRRKKRKPRVKVVSVAKATNYYLTLREGAACGDDGATALSTTPTEGASSCGHLFYGAIREALITAGQEGLLDPAGLSPHPTIYPAIDGVPFTIDAKKPILGEVVVKSRNVAEPATGGTVVENAGGGPAQLVVLLTGTVKGETVTVGETTVEYDAEPQSVSTVEFTLEPNAELAKARFESLELSLYNRGQSVAHGFYSTAGDSFITVPTIVKKKVKVRR
jgi:hypothetical protein